MTVSKMNGTSSSNPRPSKSLIYVMTAVLLVGVVTCVLSAIILTKLLVGGFFIEKIALAPESPPTTTTTAAAASGTTDSPLEWWKRTPVYQLYPRSFQDSDGDGTGDLRGIKQRIGYLQELGIKAIWLSPIYESPMADFGYDIANFTAIAPIFGTMQDFKELLEEMHKRGMYLIMDFVPNHSSDQHQWFNKSVRGEKPYDDYYVWRDEPNNWISVFGNSSWEHSPERGQYYLHEFLIQQPDLNYRNPKLRQEMIEALRFWAGQGVDGFRMDAVIYLVEDALFRNESRSGADVPENHNNYLYHNYTVNQPETFQVVHEWVSVLQEYGQANNKHIYTCTEAYTDISHVMGFYEAGVDIAFNFDLIFWDASTTASHLRQMIRNWMDHMPAGSWPNWVMGNHDNPRVASRLGGREYIDIANMLIMLLPGTPTYYFGDEIGMINGNISFEDTVDPAGAKWGPDAYKNFSRDPERTPMQWDNSPNGGFTGGKPWLPNAEEWETYNVAKELQDPNSHLSIFKALVQLRQEPVFQFATNLRMIDVGDENVFAFARESDDGRYLIVLNVGYDGKVSKVDKGLATGQGRIVLASANAELPVNMLVDFQQPFSFANSHGYVIQLL